MTAVKVTAVDYRSHLQLGADALHIAGWLETLRFPLQRYWVFS